jgi:hypothetical protein
MWLIRRTVGIVLILSAICAGVVGIVRANGGQDRLQAMGFGVCDGEPCFRGIRVGMPWSEAQRLSLDATESGPPIDFVIDENGKNTPVSVYPSDDGKTVLGIVLNVRSLYPPLSAADIVLHYGYPCRVEYIASSTGGGAILVFPKLKSSINLPDFRLSLDSSVAAIPISESRDSNPCSDGKREERGPWRGFTSAEVYLARNRSALGVTPTP